MSLSADEIREILDAVEAAGWDEARITVGDATLVVSKGERPSSGPAAPAPARAAAPAGAAQPPAASAPAPAAPDEAHAVSAPAPTGHVVVSPTVGVFWRSPEPGAPPFVEVGASVEAGTNLCIVEVMKLMNYVTTDVTGVVTAVHVANGASVASGTPLFSVEPA